MATAEDFANETLFARDLYEQLQPIHMGDADRGYPLRVIVNALGEMRRQVELLARDTDTDVGYSILLDVERCPEYALPWLAQIVGETIPPSTSEEDARQIIRDHLNWERGTVRAIVRAAQGTLTGERRVRVVERQGSPYRLTVITFGAETPDETATYRAILAQVPAGIVLTHLVQDGQIYDEAEDIEYDDAGDASYDSTIDTPLEPEE